MCCSSLSQYIYCSYDTTYEHNLTVKTKPEHRCNTINRDQTAVSIRQGNDHTNTPCSLLPSFCCCSDNNFPHYQEAAVTMYAISHLSKNQTKQQQEHTHKNNNKHNYKQTKKTTIKNNNKNKKIIKKKPQRQQKQTNKQTTTKQTRKHKTNKQANKQTKPDKPSPTKNKTNKQTKKKKEKARSKATRSGEVSCAVHVCSYNQSKLHHKPLFDCSRGVGRTSYSTNTERKMISVTASFSSTECVRFISATKSRQTKIMRLDAFVT